MTFNYSRISLLSGGPGT